MVGFCVWVPSLPARKSVDIGNGSQFPDKPYRQLLELTLEQSMIAYCSVSFT